MSKRIVLVGAGHAHLHVLAHARALIEAGHSVALVAPGRFWYSGMGPGVLSGRYSAEEDTVDVGRLVERAGGTHVDAMVSGIDAGSRELTLEGGGTIAWDLLSLNVGSGIPLDAIPGAAEHATPVKPVANFDGLRRRWLAASDPGTQRNLDAGRGAEKGETGRATEPGTEPRRVVVVGGGAAGCETAMATARLFEEAGRGAVITLVGGSRGVLPGWPARARTIMRRALAARGIELREGRRVSRIDADACHLDDGSVISCDDAVVATGVRPAPLIARSAIETDREGAMIVDDALRSVSHPHVLGGGDCIALRSRALERVGVYAVRQGPVLHDNLLRLAGGREPQPFRPQARYLLILNLSDGTGLLSWFGVALRGRFAFRFKEWLDRRFIARFQTQS